MTGRLPTLPTKSSPAHKWAWTGIDWAICASLLILVAAIFGRALTGDFVSLDDTEYVSENPHVLGGLTWASLRWAFTGTQGANWHPLTTLSHILDVQFYGLNPVGHHATSILLHSINAVAVFLVFRAMTGARWPSAAVAALFGLHPLHVESVAWISERKDVLSGFFWLATMAAYNGYVRRGHWLRYALVLVCFALGLMSKPMLVTLPFVLLLLDYWPLGRLTLPPTARAWSLMLEKLPLFALASISSVVTWRVQRAWGAVGEDADFPLGVRLSNSLVSYARYLGKIAWPDGMAAFYPHPADVPALAATAAGLLLIALTAISVRRIRSSPWLLVGWLWFLGTLVPVIGLVQVGTQAMADRYTYIPSLGIFIMLAWGVAALATRLRLSACAVTAAAGVVLVALAAGTWIQIGYWKNNITLYEHALSVTTDNYLAHHNLGEALADLGRGDDAIPHYREAVRLRPKRLDIRSDMADLLLRLGRDRDALEQYREVVRLDPTLARGHFQLAKALVSHGQTEEAVEHYREALRLWPDRPEVLRELAWIYATDQRGELRDGAEAVRLAEKLRSETPENAESFYILAAAYAETGRFPEAVEMANQAMERFLSAGAKDLAQAAKNRLDLYRLGIPYRN